MDHGFASDQRQKELTIALTASSMINGSDAISEEAYVANRKRIQEVREMVQRLEMNNENAHKNFIVDQLEKRAKDGREAEVMLAQLRNQPEHPETVQFTNDVSSGNSEVILPTTATLVEVPDSHSSIVQQGRSAEYQRNLAGQAHQVQPNRPDNFRYYTPPQPSAAPCAQAPTDGQMSWYTTPSLPLQSRVHNQPVHQPGFQPPLVQQPSQSWNSYAPPVVGLPLANSVPGAFTAGGMGGKSVAGNNVSVPGYYTSSSGWAATAPVCVGSSATSPSMRYHEPDFQSQPIGSRPPVTVPKQPQNLASPASAPGVQVPLHSVAVPPANVFYGHPPPARSFTQPAESRSLESSRPLSAAVSKPVVISELRRPRQLPQQSHSGHYQQQQQSQQQQPLRPTLQSRQHARPTQLQPQGFSHPLLQRHQERPPELQSERARARLQAPLQSLDHIPPAGVSQPHGQPSQACDSQSVNTSTMNSLREPPQLQDQAQPRCTRPAMDQATFVELFQISLQRGVQHFKAFLTEAKASGITHDRFKAAINSLPRSVWESFMAQVNPPTVDVSSSANVPQQQISTISGLNEAMTTAQPLQTGTPAVQTTPTAQPVAKPNPSMEGRISLSAPGEVPESYAAQLRYYAEQATRSAFSASISTGDINSTEQTVSTPTRDVPHAQVNRTPKDANKSTLARDILRSLGKVVEPTDKSNNHGGDRLHEVNAAQAVASIAPSVAPTGTSAVPADPPIPPAVESNVLVESSRITQSTTESVLEEEPGQLAVVQGPIMIDLTLDESDDSVFSHEPTFPVQASFGGATSPLPVSPTRTNHAPLLGDLSLEEPSIGAATHRDNADVRMYSPPLSQAAEENMEPGLLYPPVSGTERRSPGFDPLPRETSELPPDGQLPLFLPSPSASASPAPTEPPETDLEMTNDEGQSGPSHKQRSVDVGEMEFDATLLIPPRVRKRPRQQVYVLIPPAPLYVKRAIKKMKEHALGNDIDLDLEGVGGDEIQYSHLELLLIEESKSRLSERRCRWLNCGAVLNCAANLLAHLKIHAHEEDSQAPFNCRWASCQSRFETEHERDEHLERHSIRPLPCPFAGCEEQFNRPVEVMQHEVQHQKTEHSEPLVRKASCQPTVPAIPARLGPPPHRLPSHRVIPRRVVKCRISADRHAIMGPWVLWNIFSPVELNTRKQNASMRGRPGRQAVNYDMDSSDARRDDYDFLLALSSYPAKYPQPDDLDSTLITMSAARGLTLWGSGSSSADQEREPEEKPETANESRRGSPFGVGEEDAVERMLIL